MYTTHVVILALISGVNEIKAFGYNPTGCLDVAIVGGGIGGTYTGWRLRHQGLTIAIFENTNRIGGRMFSVFLPSLPNVPAELGAMRYLAGVHTTLESLFPKLGLRSQVFQPDQFKKVYYLRGKRLSAEQLDSPELPYNLAPGESRNRSLLRWNLSQRALNVSEPDQISDIEEVTTPDGVPVYKQGYLQAMDKIWSSEAKQYLKQMSGFCSFYDRRVNAVRNIVASNPSDKGTERWTVSEGMNEVPKRLLKQFLDASRRHVVKLNRRVDSIMKVWSGIRYVYHLTIYQTETLGGYTRDTRARHVVCANRVILAIPPGALKNIQWYPLQHDPAVRAALNSVNEFSAMKIFLAYPHAWWDNLRVNNTAFLTDLPLRQGGEFGRFRNTSGQETAMMMVSYADGQENNDFWWNLHNYRGTVSSSAVPDAFSVSRKVVEHVNHHLATMYDVSPNSIPWPLDGVMKIWDDELNGKAWQLFKPGYQPKVVADFIRRPSMVDQVFVVTNGFSRKFSSWSEGCLRAVDNVLSEFFHVI